MVQKELAIQSHQGAMLHSRGIPSRSGPSRQATWACHNISLSLGCHLGSGMDILGISPLPISSLPSSSNVFCPALPDVFCQFHLHLLYVQAFLAYIYSISASTRRQCLPSIQHLPTMAGPHMGSLYFAPFSETPRPDNVWAPPKSSPLRRMR